jgi:GcrA cell cycle regulator
MWSEERVTLLKKLWIEGLSASEIAKQLGGVTRNAVIGKVHRLGLPLRETPVRTVVKRPRMRPRAAPRPPRDMMVTRWRHLPKPTPPAHFDPNDAASRMASMILGAAYAAERRRHSMREGLAR